MSDVWEGIITPEEINIYREAGFSGKVGVGKRPALLIIDVQYRTVGLNKPIINSIRESQYKTGCGEMAWAAVLKIQKLLKVVRKKKYPVFYAVVVRSNEFDAGRWFDKIPAFGKEQIHREGDHGTEIVKEIAPVNNDIVISKRYPSAFFGTHLMTILNLKEVDTMIMTGCTTSGCVRASVVDAFSYGFKVIVPHDCVYDRCITSHKVNLFDMNAKYADIVSSSKLLEMI